MAGQERASLPQDKNNRTVQLTPPKAALAQTYDATISSSTEVTLNASTTFIEVTAIDKGIFMKWGTDDVTNANFDEFIGPNQTRQFYVPEETAATNTLYTAVNFLEEAATAKLVVIEK